MAARLHEVLGLRLSPHHEGFFVPWLASNRHVLSADGETPAASDINASPHMDYLAELGNQGFHQADDQPDSDGRVEFNSDLFRGTAGELTVQVYAINQEELDREVVPVLQAVLPQVAAMVDALGEIDADLAQVILYRGRLGLHFWSRGVNNEFTAVYTHRDGRWVFRGFGEIFGEG